MQEALSIIQNLEPGTPFLLLNSNSKQRNGPENYFTKDWILAIGEEQLYKASELSFDQLSNKLDGKWWFGYLSYDLKNNFEKLESNNEDLLNAEDYYLFNPKSIFQSLDGKINILKNNLGIEIGSHEHLQFSKTHKIEFNERISKQNFLNTVNHIKNEIIEGNVYELNFCQEYYSKIDSIDLLNLYGSFNNFSPMPFSACGKIGHLDICCASPERFFKKEGELIYSQPIKGTKKRSSNKQRDQQLAIDLLNDEKERAENVMIVDLVRNDLSRACIPGTVRVPELFGIYSFPAVHQMISTIEGSLRPGTNFVDIIKALFPMGSMTGAPKISAMHLIDCFEKVQRGLYSGSIGYIDPSGNMDWNVVIRSLIHNRENGHLSFQAGGAITIDSDPEKEYEEMQLKARAVFELFNQ